MVKPCNNHLGVVGSERNWWWDNWTLEWIQQMNTFSIVPHERHIAMSWNFTGQLINVYLDSKRVSVFIEAVLPSLPMLYLPFNVYLDSKRVSVFIEAVLPSLPMLYLPFNVYLDSKRVSVLIEAVLPSLPMLYLGFKLSKTLMESLHSMIYWGLTRSDNVTGRGTEQGSGAKDACIWDANVG